MVTSRDNIDSLTGLRAVAALMVVLGHTLTSFHYQWMLVCVPGMSLFFTLSGFIIHYVYAGSFGSNWSVATRDFAVARISRLYPLYLTLLVFNLLMEPMASVLTKPENLPYLLAYVLGIWTWWPVMIDHAPMFDWQYGISWSISTELFFYVVYALVLYRIARMRSVIGCVAALVGFCLASYFVFWVLMATRDTWEPLALQQFPQFTPREPDFSDSFYRWLLYVCPYTRILEFIGGVLTCQLFLLVRGKARLCSRLSLELMTWLGVAVILGCAQALSYYAYRNAWLAPHNSSFGGLVVNLHMNFLFAPGCYLLILSLALGKSTIGQVLGSRVGRFAGDVSYSTYLSHPYAQELVGLSGLWFTYALPLVMAVLSFVYVLSWMLNFVVEIPGKRFLRQLLQPRAITVPVVVGDG